MEKTGKALDGSAFDEKTVSRYKASNDLEMLITRNNSYVQFIVISFPDFPMMKLRASFPDKNNAVIFSSLEYLAGSTHGWSEYTLELAGETVLSFDDDNKAVLETLKIEKIRISEGRIHRYDSRITGNEALTALRNRRERVISTVEWMRANENVSEKQSLKAFEKYWKPVLFPEIVLFNKRPSGWKLEDDIFEFSDDIRWNKGYTMRTFPEELHNIRNSGTMLRDWEEALSWIYMEYMWETITETFTKNIIFTKIK